MSTITRVGKAGGGTNFNAGQIIDPAEVNDDFNTVYSVVNGGLDETNIASGSITAASIAPGSVTAASLAPNSVGETQIQTGAIPGAKNLKFTETTVPSTPAALNILTYGYGHNNTSHLTVMDSTGRTLALGAHTSVGGAVGGARGGTVGFINSYTAGSSTPANTTETDLIAYTFPGSGLNTDGACLRIRCHWLTGANANTKTIRVYFGTVVVALAAGAYNTHVAVSDTLIQRTSASSGRYTSTITSGPVGVAAASYMFFNDIPGVGWTNPFAIKVTGQNGVATAGDITAYCLNVEIMNPY